MSVFLLFGALIKPIFLRFMTFEAIVNRERLHFYADWRHMALMPVNGFKKNQIFTLDDCEGSKVKKY